MEPNNLTKIIELTKQLDYLELTSLETALASRRYNMRKEEERKFKSLSESK